MTHLITLKTKGLGEGTKGSVAPELLLENNPVTTTWEQDKVDGLVRAGIWEITPSMNISIKGHIWEYCHILEGVCIITPEGGQPVTYRAGDKFIMKPGFKGTWKTIETIKKLYVIVG